MKVASTASMNPMTKSFVQEIHDFAKQEGIDIIPFTKGQRKDEVTQERASGEVLRSRRASGAMSHFRPSFVVGGDKGYWR